MKLALSVIAVCSMMVISAYPALAQSEPMVAAQPAGQSGNSLPVNTLVIVTPANEITSKEMKEGTRREFLVVEDVVQNGLVVIPRGAPVEATVTWRTGKGIVGKSAKFELSFDWVRIGAHNWKLRGTHRQEGRGNTAGALLGAAVITGRSAVMTPGQTVNVFTAEPIPFREKVPAKAEATNVDSPAVDATSSRQPSEIKISTKDD